MKSFKHFITYYEAFNPNEYVNKVMGKTASLFIEHMQTINETIINKMKNPIVALVKSEDGEFDENYQMKLIKKINPNVTVITAFSGYIPDIINEIRKSDIEIEELFVDDDRISRYKRQIESFNKQVPTEKQISIKLTKL